MTSGQENGAGPEPVEIDENLHSRQVRASRRGAGRSGVRRGGCRGCAAATWLLTATWRCLRAVAALALPAHPHAGAPGGPALPRLEEGAAAAAACWERGSSSGSTAQQPPRQAGIPVAENGSPGCWEGFYRMSAVKARAPAVSRGRVPPACRLLRSRQHYWGPPFSVATLHHLLSLNHTPSAPAGSCRCPRQAVREAWGTPFKSRQMCPPPPKMLKFRAAGGVRQGVDEAHGHRQHPGVRPEWAGSGDR